MRVKTIDYLLDHIVWLFIFILPFIAYWIMLRTGTVTSDWSTFMTSNFNFGDNIFYSTLYDVFGSGGVIDLIGDNCDGVIRYLTYLFTCTLLHLVFDILIFIPRLCIKWVEDISKRGDI